MLILKNKHVRGCAGFVKMEWRVEMCGAILSQPKWVSQIM